MAKKTDARELLDEVLILIAADIDRINEKSNEDQLDAEMSGRLVKYSDALLKITKDSDGQKEAEKSKLANMSNAELSERARQAMEKLKK